MTQKQCRSHWEALQRLRHKSPKFFHQCRNAGVSQGPATNADAKRSSATGNSRAHIAPFTAMVSATYSRTFSLERTRMGGRRELSVDHA